MSRFASLARRVATGLVAAQLTFGAVSGATLAAAAPARAAELAWRGDWKGFSTSIDGVTYLGAIARMPQGGTAAILIKDGAPTLLLTDPAWTFDGGVCVPVRLTIDGQAYALTADAHGDVIEIAHLDEETLAKLVGGTRAEIDAQDGVIIRTLDLDGFAGAMPETVKPIQA